MKSAFSKPSQRGDPHIQLNALTVDAQVLLRIAKHAKQNYPASSAGSLLGLDTKAGPNKTDVHVSSCFAYHKKNTENLEEGKEKESKASKEHDAFTDYQIQMLQALSEVRADANSVGWYESTHHGNFMTEGFIESQYLFQKAVPHAVVLVYNPYLQRVGTHCGFQAYRLTQKAMELRTERADEEDPFAGFPGESLLEEVPIKMHMSPYIETIVLQMNRHKFASLGVSSMAPTLERNVNLLLESMDEFALHQRELQQYERMTRLMKEKQAKNTRVPKSIDTATISRQVKHHCETLDQQISTSFSKLHLLANDEDTKQVFSEMTQAMQAEG